MLVPYCWSLVHSLLQEQDLRYVHLVIVANRRWHLSRVTDLALIRSNSTPYLSNRCGLRAVQFDSGNNAPSEAKVRRAVPTRLQPFRAQPF